MDSIAPTRILADGFQTTATNTLKQKLDRTAYTVAWICAISTEQVAAHAFLDKEHERLEYMPNNDNNDYTLGEVGKHNVVIAVLPIGEYGISSATRVAKDLLRSFPNIRVFLMVGIGGGAPSQMHDIRLGDIVVSVPGRGNGGVFQYDFGKTIQDKPFCRTGFQNQPPTFIRTAVNGLKTQNEMKGHHFGETINRIVEENSNLRVFKRPHSSTDRLYKSEVTHPSNSQASCATCCGSDSDKLVQRSKRTEQNDGPMIHYGLIASANQVMKDAKIRDKLAEEKGVLCFEMEAAGLMNEFPCLVIRGICDYADSHKSKEWQGYAAMAAAAYAKDLLYRLPPSEVEAEKKIRDMLSVSTGLPGTADKQLQIQQDAFKQKRSEEQEQCLQLFRRTDSNRDITYEWYKDRVEDRVEGTCQWFLQHPYFQKWLEQDSGPLLVSADPGCGKSVLAKYLVDQVLPQSSSICYFFFQEQDQNKICQALCALLHQLFSQQPSLIDHAMPQFRKDGQGLINSTQSLWTVLGNAVKDPQACPIILVLDALDECAEPDLENLARNLKSQFITDQIGHSGLKYLLTSRPYEKIMRQFRDRNLLATFQNIHIPGEEESEVISQEVNYVITHRVEQLSEKNCLSPSTKSHLRERLQRTTHRTYLWVYLIFNNFEDENFKKTPRGIDSFITTIPRNINEAYEQILNKSNDEDHLIRIALSIILAAGRPLTLSEMNIAINIEYTSKSIDDLDLEDEKDFKTRLRSLCGLFVSIHEGRIYFLHQTVREFLLADMASQPAAIPSQIHWQHSITLREAHNVLAVACVLYLNLLSSDVKLPTGLRPKAHDFIMANDFLDYSAKFWGTHLREASITSDATIMPGALKICDRHSPIYSIWAKIYFESEHFGSWSSFTGLAVPSILGIYAIVEVLLESGVDIEAKSSDGKTPLLWATQIGYKAVVEQLLEKGANIEAEGEDGITPLSCAAERGDETMVKLLLEKGANIEAGGKHGVTPLLYAAERGHETVVKQLLEKSANIEAGRIYGRTPLSCAAERGDETIVKLLLEKGANIEAGGKHGITPLSYAAEMGHETMVKLLLEKGANIEAGGEHGITLLSCAAEMGDETVVKLLLEKSANIETGSIYGRTPLLCAAERGHETVVKLLLEKGANIEAEGEDGITPLSCAAERGHKTVVKLLLEKGANIEAGGKHGVTPLLYAVERGHETVVELLLEKGANIETGGIYGRTPLLCAAERGHETIVKLLLEKGANIEAEGTDNRTPLLCAVEKKHEPMVKLLLEKGANIKVRDKHSQTLLLWAAEKGLETMAKLLLENGADIESTSRYGRTLLSWAAGNGHETVAKMLLDRGAKIEAKGDSGKTPLSWAARNGHEFVVMLLLERGADIEAKDNCGRTPLLWAAEDEHEVIVELLLSKGADIETKDNGGRTPLWWAAEDGHELMVKLLLERGADIETKNNRGITPLILVLENERWLQNANTGYLAVAELLLDKGACIEARRSYCRRMLLSATANGCENIVKLLLERGFDIEAKSSDDRTLLSLAAGKGYETMVKMLLEKGADIKAKDSPFDRTVLSWAATGGHEGTVKLLLENQAEPNSTNKFGQTPLSRAIASGHEPLVKMLLDSGANVGTTSVDRQRLLVQADKNGYDGIAKLLKEHGANAENRDNQGRASLS